MTDRRAIAYALAVEGAISNPECTSFTVRFVPRANGDGYTFPEGNSTLRDIDAIGKRPLRSSGHSRQGHYPSSPPCEIAQTREPRAYPPDSGQAPLCSNARATSAARPPRLSWDYWGPCSCPSTIPPRQPMVETTLLTNRYDRVFVSFNAYTLCRAVKQDFL